MSEDKTPHQIWLLAAEVSVVEATLLVIGVEPQGVSEDIERWGADARPVGYLAASEAIASAISRGEVEGRIESNYSRDLDGFVIDEVGPDFARSRVVLRSLREWLQKQGYTDTFLKLDKTHGEGFRNPEHPRYSAKLAAVVAAWEEYDETVSKTGTPKQKMEIWLRKNAARFDLFDDEGNPKETIIQKLAQVANWATSGGAPRQQSNESESDNFDNKINNIVPF